MNLAVFDLDHTLLNGDSDYLWGQFLVANDLVDGDYYTRENQRFYDQYAVGTLDIHEFAAFSLKPLTEHPLAIMEAIRARFVTECIAPIVSRDAPALLARHRAQGDELLITTATNRFIVEPIAEHLGVAHLLATEPERDGPRFTGRIAKSNFRDAKVVNLKAWLAAHPVQFERLYGYSDSQNDLPLLEFTDHPHAVDADPVLKAEAEKRGWPVISLRG
ncbi:HAD family phosphatase [Nevskia sp.]|uniref:HAD family hydrolase n=1 Tax=Nevskia sp. TaxID=1929292 RepID=UPI0025DBE7DC|nr:HAD family hydrolase [Nevskia sp.]